MNTKERCDIAIPVERLEYLKTLYYVEKRSTPEISEITGYSISSLHSFMNRHDLARRSTTEQNRIKFDRKEPSFILKQNLSHGEEMLKMAGVMLYWAEGFKSKSAQGVDFANSDPAMAITFLRFLRDICGINESKLRVFLYCYGNQDVPSLINFWKDITGVPEEQFTKPHIRRDFDVAKSGKMPNGLVHIRYGDKRLLFILKEWIAKYGRDGIM